MNKIDLSKLENFTYSAVMRQLRQNASKEQVVEFLDIFKSEMDSAWKQDLQQPDQVALQNAMVKFNDLHPVHLPNFVKNAAISELGDPVLVGKYLADIIRFTLNKISPAKREIYIAKVRNKIHALDEKALSYKNMPASASMGQSITFVKHVLFNQNPSYIRDVLDNINKNL